MDPSEAARRATENRGPQAAIIIICFTVGSFCAVVLRFLTRFFITKRPGIEDAFIGIAILFSIAMSFCQVQQVQYGSGKHVEVVTDEETLESFRYLFWSIHAYNCGLTFTKLAILLLYRRIFAFRKMRIACYVLMAFVIGYGIQAVIVQIFTCQPIRAFWDRSIEGRKCLPEFTIFYVNAALNMSTDFAIDILPMPAIRKLQMPKRQKISLMAILALGAFVCVVSILRLHALIELENSPDPTWIQPATAYWSAIELNTGIICGCLPTLRPLITRFAPRIFGSLHNHSHDQPYSCPYRGYQYKDRSAEDDLVMLPRAKRNGYGKFAHEMEPTYETVIVGGAARDDERSFSSSQDGLTVSREIRTEITKPSPSVPNRGDNYGW